MPIRKRALKSAVILSCAVLPLQAHGANPARQINRLPDRMLFCAIRHIINFDPSKEQSAAELQFDSVHPFTLFLPGIAKRASPPPEAFEKPDPVDTRTRIVADPDKIAPQPGHRFERVVDFWPDRVELASTISGALLNVIVINPIDLANGTANLFMTRATELTNFDRKHIYQGQCRFRLPPPRPVRTPD